MSCQSPRMTLLGVALFIQSVIDELIIVVDDKEPTSKFSAKINEAVEFMREQKCGWRFMYEQSCVLNEELSAAEQKLLSGQLELLSPWSRKKRRTAMEYLELLLRLQAAYLRSEEREDFGLPKGISLLVAPMYQK